MEVKKSVSRAGRPSPEEAQRKKAALITAAVEEFSRVGFEAASLRDIARKADISSRTLYNYFPDKVSLFDACLGQSGQLTYPDITAMKGTLEERLVAYTIDIQRQLSHPDNVLAARLLFRESGRFQELSEVFRRQFERTQIIPVASMLQDQGISKISSRRLAAHFVAMAFGEWQRRVLLGGDILTDAEIEQQAQEAATIFLGGISALKLSEK